MRTWLIAPLLLLAASHACAHDGAWVASVTGLCLAQDDSYARLPTGALLMQDESMPRFIASLPPDLRQCLKANKAATAPLCKALLSPEPNPGPTNAQYAQMAKRYQKELALLRDMPCGHPPR